MKKCVFAGTFDPPTLGHKAMVEECLKLFDFVVVGVLDNSTKRPYFTDQERLKMLQLMFGKEERVKAVLFSGTAAELLEKENATIYVRGVRNTVDFEYENENFFASSKLKKDMLTVYLPCPQELLHVSSHMARNALKFSAPLSDYVTKEVEEYIRARQTEKEDLK